MITHELAKQLKDSGFPQYDDMVVSADNIKEMSSWKMYQFHKQLDGWHSVQDFDKPRPSGQFTREYLDSKKGKEKTVYIPTLSELIEACGKEFRWLKHRGNEWFAQQRQHPVELGDIRALGDSPEESVAKLWLALKRK